MRNLGHRDYSNSVVLVQHDDVLEVHPSNRRPRTELLCSGIFVPRRRSTAFCSLFKFHGTKRLPYVHRNSSTVAGWVKGTTVDRSLVPEGRTFLDLRLLLSLHDHSPGTHGRLLCRPVVELKSERFRIRLLGRGGRD